MNYLIEIIQIEDGKFVARYKKNKWLSSWRTLKTYNIYSKYGTCWHYDTPVYDEFPTQEAALGACKAALHRELERVETPLKKVVLRTTYSVE